MVRLNCRLLSCRYVGLFLGGLGRLGRFCLRGSWSAGSSCFLLTACFFFALAATNFTWIVRCTAGAADRCSRCFDDHRFLFCWCRCLFLDSGLRRDVRRRLFFHERSRLGSRCLDRRWQFG
ncbi:hypothetical protein KPSA1_02141 [Pseudomonas syringae pv. actinidiae]|uniref:Uncharacterized protein n=1 Tax=Pseudomonas syringae pv. actinidiae TaxID=103796 RepID=A0A2V0QJJ7_PSESF|nr:hypothetical protein KPSA1_02141 [Pseudomonas syringae pv. actinidiae]GBH19226.1 hypothetical protein KPSA3_05232 [Pseudomonas syringae pv. actinidiae]